MIEKIISGAQSGVDLAALDAAKKLGLPTGGYMNRGFRNENGFFPEYQQRYNIQEISSTLYADRTELNVRESQATLILTETDPSGGTKLTASLCRRFSKPCLLYFLSPSLFPEIDEDREGVLRYSLDRISILNVAGPRESHSPGIYRKAYEFLVHFLGKEHVF